MSPHKIDVLPSAAALPSYGISKNGFLPASTPLIRLPHTYYQPWESIVEELPTLIENQTIRQRVDELPILDTSKLESESEWQRAYSMLAIIAQGYIWQGPEPSEVSSQSAGSIDVTLITDCRIATSSCHICSIHPHRRTSPSSSYRYIRCFEPLELETIV
jgi:hypothetical protein